MFKRTAKFKRGNRSQPHVDVRFQYFQHYWRIAKSVNIDIFFDTVRMESHPYLIEKIQYQLDHNFNKSFDKFCNFFLLHPLFDTSNIIGKVAAIQRIKNDIRALCVQSSGVLEVDKPGVYRSNETRIKTLFTSKCSALTEKCYANP